MEGVIFLVKDDGELVELAEEQYDSEILLQNYLERHPALLAGDQIDSQNPRRFLLISREAVVPDQEGGQGRWALDHLFVDQDGVPTLVEVKRSTDTRIRREVVGQMLDYAANGVLYWPRETMRELFEARQGKTAAEVLRDFLESDEDYESFWDKVYDNLRTGKIRLLFVADKIPPELQSIVEFLNKQMSPAEVLAEEIRQFGGQPLRTMVPRIIGQTAEAGMTKGGGRKPARQWDYDSFITDLGARAGKESVTIFQRIFDWAREKNLKEAWVKGPILGSYRPFIKKNGAPQQLFGVYITGAVEVVFKHHPLDTPELKRELFDRLNELDGLTLPEKGLAGWPSFPLLVLARGGNLAEFLAIFDWVIEQIKAKPD